METDTLIRKKLEKRGFSLPHINFLLNNEKKVKARRKRRVGSSKLTQKWQDNIDGNIIITKSVTTTFKEPLISDVVDDATLNEFKEICHYLTDEMAIIDIQKLIYPFYDEEILNAKSVLAISLIERGIIEPLFYPWQRSSLAFSVFCKPEILTNNRRLDYVELSFDCKKQAIIQLNDYQKHFPDVARVWESYLNNHKNKLAKAKKVNSKYQLLVQKYANNYPQHKANHTRLCMLIAEHEYDLKDGTHEFKKCVEKIRRQTNHPNPPKK